MIQIWTKLFSPCEFIRWSIFTFHSLFDLPSFISICSFQHFDRSRANLLPEYMCRTVTCSDKGKILLYLLEFSLSPVRRALFFSSTSAATAGNWWEPKTYSDRFPVSLRFIHRLYRTYEKWWKCRTSQIFQKKSIDIH